MTPRGPINKSPHPTPAEARDALLNELRRTFWIVAILVMCIWLVSVIDWLAFGGRLETFGIVPRTQRGLLGILFAPFLHGGLGHLLVNTGGLAVFGGLVILRQERDFWVITIVGGLTSGVGIWLVGRAGVHIGASGVIFAYFGYLLFTGWFERRVGSLLLSMLVFVTWWRTLFGLVPVQQGISWEGHLFGLLGGVLAAWHLARRRRAIGT